MSTPAVTPERKCACGCGASLGGMRSDAIWRTRACAERWRRANPGKALSDARIAHIVLTRKPSGNTVSYPKAERHIAMTFTSLADQIGWAGTLTVAQGGELALRALHDALPAKQRAALRERSAA